MHRKEKEKYGGDGRMIQKWMKDVKKREKKNGGGKGRREEIYRKGKVTWEVLLLWEVEEREVRKACQGSWRG